MTQTTSTPIHKMCSRHLSNLFNHSGTSPIQLEPYLTAESLKVSVASLDQCGSQQPKITIRQNSLAWTAISTRIGLHMLCMKAKSIAIHGVVIDLPLLDMGACYFRTLREILHWTAILDTLMETYSQASTSTIESCSGNTMTDLTTWWCWRKKSMMVRLHHTTTPTEWTNRELTLAWDNYSLKLEKVIYTTGTKSANSMDTHSTQAANQTSTQVKCLELSTLTCAKSSLIKASTAELETLQVATKAEHLFDRDSPDDG